MKLQFYKYQGTGNDFVIIDNRNKVFDPNNRALVKQLCDRRFGIGADGFMLLENEPGFDFKMVYYNADGNESTMCGNGGRCLVKFAYHQGVFKDSTTFLAIDGPHEAYIKNNIVHLKMIDVEGVEENATDAFLNTGSPHYVAFVDNIQQYNVFDNGKEVRYSERFKNGGGTNANFIEKVGENEIFVRTYERGVEDETYSCGTGVTASAIIASRKGMGSPIKVKTLGGDLSVNFESLGDKYVNVYLNGPAELVFKGEVEV